ncbi:MAG: ATPase domain-containing protein, partial [Chitinophagales bacterium]
YRGSTHGTNEYPFLIDEHGISVIPVTSLKLDYKSFSDIISTGLPALDELFSGQGIFKASSSLITGSAGTAKTILASHFAMSSCKRKEMVLYFSFEESPNQLARNMAEIGIKFKPQIKSGLLHIHASRPSLQGLEMHLLVLHKFLTELKPQTVIIDPISSLITLGSSSEVRGMLIRLMDTLKVNEINALFTSLTPKRPAESNDAILDAVSSLADTWIKLDNEDTANERVRTLSIVKSRGMGHFNGKQHFTITNQGILFN